MEWLAALVAIVIGVPAAAWLAQDRLIFFPQPLSSTAHLPPRAEPIEVVAADGVRLRGWIRAADVSPSPAVIYFGGNAEEVSWTIADARWPGEWRVVALNYRGYGESEGAPGEKELTADALDIHAAVARRSDVDAGRIVAFGRSLGAGIAVRLAAERPLAGVVLASPYDSLTAIGRMHYPWLPVSLLLRHRFDVLPIAPRVHAPMLTLVAQRDAIIPAARSRALFDAWAGPKAWEVVPGTDHNSLGAPDAYWVAIGRFLASMPRSPTARDAAGSSAADTASR